MILGEIIIAGLLLSLVSGGAIRHLQEQSLHGEALLLMLFTAQLAWPAVSRRLALQCSVSVAIWVAMMFGLVVILLFNVQRYPTLAIAAAGIVANMIVISLNGAMPVSIRASSEMGVVRAQARASLERDCLHEQLDAGTRLKVLADVIPTPGPSWQRSVVSAGDLLLAAGLSSWVFRASRRP